MAISYHTLTRSEIGGVQNKVVLDDQRRCPVLVNLRLDPFERTGLNQSLFAKDWWGNEFWRFVFVQQEVAKAAESFIEFPPMQKGASFNMEAVKAQVQEGMRKHAGN